MKTILLFAFALILSGCGGAKVVKNSFPELPPKLMDKPQDLKTIKPPTFVDATTFKDDSASGVQLSELAKVLSENYATCNAYKEQIFSLQGWIIQQKKLNP